MENEPPSTIVTKVNSLIDLIKSFFADSPVRSKSNTIDTTNGTTNGTTNSNMSIPKNNTVDNTSDNNDGISTMTIVAVVTSVTAIAAAALLFKYTRPKPRVVEKENVPLVVVKPDAAAAADNKITPRKRRGKHHNRLLSMKMSPASKSMMDILRREALAKRTIFSAWSKYTTECKEDFDAAASEGGDNDDVTANSGMMADDDWDKFIAASKILSADSASADNSV